MIPIRIPSLMGGVSTRPQNERLAHQLEESVNCDVVFTRGSDKRAGTEIIDGEGAANQLNYTNLIEDTEELYFFWINRSATERFVGIINPAATSAADVIQIFSAIDGTKKTVEGDGDDNGVFAAMTDASNANLITYLKAGSQTARERFRAISIEDATFILNRTVVTALEGSAITYRDTAGAVNVRNKATSPNNEVSWSAFTHPPGTAAAYPSRATLVAGGNIDSDAIWYAQNDDVGHPQGFYWAISASGPPWFQRLPTEMANSFISRTTMPIRIDWTGSVFRVSLVNWTPRYSGDSFTNPGPTFIGSALSDIAFHQGRMWFCAGERIVSSRAGDLFNFWIDSEVLVTDADPIDEGIQGNRISNGIHLETFRESLEIITDGNRQVEVRSNGPITPSTTQFFDSTNVFAVDYCHPIKSGAQMYFVGERDYANIIWQYDYEPQQISNIATDITRDVHGYIPAEAHWLTASDSQSQIYCLTLADPDSIYVYKTEWNGREIVLSSWYRWEFPGVTEVKSCFVFDNDLYCVMERPDDSGDRLLYLETVALGLPQQDTDGTPVQTLSYSVRVDRKQKLQGVYDTATDTTTWTVPFEDADIDEVILAATWDTEEFKLAGTRLTGFTVTVGSNSTTVSIAGDYENNSDGTNAPAYIGRSYSAYLILSEQFVRDEQGLPLNGNLNLTRGRIRHKDSGGYTVSITPEGRSELTKIFVVPFIGSTPLDSDQLDDFGEFQFRVMCHSRNAVIKLLNDTPYPTAWLDMEFDTTFVPTFSPVR